MQNAHHRGTISTATVGTVNGCGSTYLSFTQIFEIYFAVSVDIIGIDCRQTSNTDEWMESNECVPNEIACFSVIFNC